MGRLEGITVGDVGAILDGSEEGVQEGDLLGIIVGTLEGILDGITDGAMEGILVGIAVGDTVPTTNHWPQDEPELATRVLVLALNTPVIPVIVTSAPVTAPIFIPETQAGAVVALVSRGIQLPCEPAAVVL